MDEEHLKMAVESNPTVTLRELSKEFGVSHMTIHRRLMNLVKVMKLA